MILPCSRVQSKEQKLDMEEAFLGISNFKDIDYVGCWFIKSAKYINNSTKAALVSTSSICEGSQVKALWPHIKALNVEVYFAHKSFHWANNAKDKAGVTCSIIGLRANLEQPKYLFTDGLKKRCKNINAYLIDGIDVYVKSEKKPLMNVPAMLSGNYTGHAQPLMLDAPEKENLLQCYPQTTKFLRKVIGSNELIKGIQRWCLWITDEDYEEAMGCQEIKDRVELVKAARLKSVDKLANKLALRPHQFRDLNETKLNSIVVPTVSSERRNYMPIGFIDKGTIVTNKAMVLYDVDPHMFSILSSNMHMVWVKAIAGRLRKDISYSSVICYNTFPFPKVNEDEKEEFLSHTLNIMAARERYPNKTLAELYDPKKMPPDLLVAHKDNDKFVDSLYKNESFINDDDRLEELFSRYIQMTGGQNA
ncbi:type IIL restriction-modification enzyme MmeI [Pseudoalteromonas sp. S3260]|uniref:type IIL restriction-modification enzyme MmeI n=1 Tax=Pseudoalteromonas sp. S3260 TaxID=579534 RepID=UPI0032E438F7